ncbi:ribosome biogenesis GTP-binding protein YihA/YsxC [Nitrospira sp. Kam-Ns4a]
MHILAAEFIKSCRGPGEFPAERLPEVACVGRSNVGKSSLLNSLLRRQGLAQVSGTPGKTRLLNLYRVTTGDPRFRRLYLVDLPGYGYAKVGKAERARWAPMIEAYLTGRPELRGVLLLVDARGPQPQDQTALGWLQGAGLATVLVATKIDKLSRGERAAQLAAIRRFLALPPETPLIPYSAVTHEGRDELWAALRALLAASGPRPEGCS